MVKYEIPNITPFSDVYYVECLYLSFFTAIKYFNGSIFSLIANDYFVYNLEQTMKGLSLKLEIKQVLSIPEMAKHSGITVENRYDYGSDIISNVIDILLHGELVLLPIDSYYYKHPFHNLFYLKEHHKQTLLVFGFDNEKKVLKIVDVNGFEWNTNKCCFKHEISYQDMIKCHEESINLDQNAPNLIRISKDNTNKVLIDDPSFYKGTMVANMKLHKNDILKGLENIRILSENIEQFDIGTSAFGNKVTSLANQYKMKSILGNEYTYDPLMKDIIEIWAIVEGLFYKSEFNGRSERKKLSSRLKQLYDLESLLYEQLFQLFDTV